MSQPLELYDLLTMANAESCGLKEN